MNIFITGASGNIGTKLSEALASAENNLFLLSSDENFLPSVPATVVVGDLLSPATYKDYLDNIDLVIHLAAVIYTNKKDLYYLVNTKGTKTIVSLAQKANVKRFLFVSTRAISAKGGAYSDSKRLAERIVRASSLVWVIVRLAEVYGENQIGFVAKLRMQAESSFIIPIVGDGKAKIAPVHVDDVISAMKSIVFNKKIENKVYTLAGPVTFSYNSFVDYLIARQKRLYLKVSLPIFLIRIFAQIQRVLKINPPLFVADQIPRLLVSKSADSSLAKQDLGYNPREI